MKDDKNLYDDDLDNEHEIGVAINEQGRGESIQAAKDRKLDDDDYLFSANENNEDEEDNEELEDAEDKKKKGGLAFAESSKDRLIEKIKGNLVYIFIALILIIPGSMKLYNMLAGNEGVPVKNTQPVTFNSTNPTPEKTVPASTPAEAAKPTEKLPATEVKPAVSAPQEENAARSFFDNVMSIGSGSAETSDNMLETKGEKETPLKAGEKSEIASIQNASKQPREGEQILDRIFAQESKVEQQLTELLGRMDEIDARLAPLEDMDKRLTELEKNNSAQTNEQLGQVLKRVGQLEQSVNQLRSQKSVAPAREANVGVNTTTPQNLNAGSASGISVEAVIPGRAWVRNQDGVLMVVEVGDEIPGVGKVTRIDAREGIVATTTQIFKQ